MSVLLIARGWNGARWRDRLSRRLPGRPVIPATEPFDPESIHYATSWGHEPGELAHLPNLRLIFSLGAGVDHLLSDPDLPDVPVARVIDPDLTFRMGEWVALHTLGHHRQAARFRAQQAARVWEDDDDQPAARDVRVGIMGMGVLGVHAAGVLRAIGFDIAGWSRTRRETGAFPMFAGAGELGPFLARTDILVCLLPLTPETGGILNAGLFAGLARDGRLGGPFLLNAGRGGLQVESDILAALDSGVLKGVTLDVFGTEPLPRHSPFWTHPGVTVTPHNGAMSEPDVVASMIADGITAFERGDRLANLIDRKAGY